MQGEREHVRLVVEAGFAAAFPDDPIQLRLVERTGLPGSVQVELTFRGAVLKRSMAVGQNLASKKMARTQLVDDLLQDARRVAGLVP